MLFIIIYGYRKKIDVYDSFIEGSKESFSLIKNLFPTYIAMIFAINIFINSGIFNMISFFLNPLFNKINVPIEIIPLALLRPISSSASLAYLNTILSKYSPDSFIGILSSVIQGCTDTTFYIIALYFGCIGIKKIRYSLVLCLIADIIGIITSIILASILFKNYM